MTQMPSHNRAQIARFILVPSVITLVITLLRMVGELRHWSPSLFNPSAGGGGALVGITWLVPIFGIYFALKLAGAGEGPAAAGRAIGMAVLGFIVMAGGSFLAVAPQITLPGKLVIGLLLIVAAAALQFRAWPALSKALLAYGYAARIPVALLTFFAIRGNWGTHYDALPPGFPEMRFWPRYVQTALVPQLVFWVAFTVVVGSLFGSIATAIFNRRNIGVPAHGQA
ncbi:MAG: hypothetical protein DMG06_01555 [Acidobacteria bacterium]|nr:MAG: hypothetical protein DMG06_01555 [Acidobacteriota bacterium]